MYADIIIKNGRCVTMCGDGGADWVAAAGKMICAAVTQRPKMPIVSSLCPRTHSRMSRESGRAASPPRNQTFPQ